MEHQRWPLLNQALRGLAGPCPSRDDFSDAETVRVYYGAVLHERPVSWA